jgi:multicomponent Na+:H+ antiporter subunit A
MFTVLIIFFVLPLLTAWMPKSIAGYRTGIFAIAQIGAFVFLAFRIGDVLETNTITQSVQWIPRLGLDLSLKLDSLSMIFGLLITGIGTLVFLFAISYMKSYDGKGRFGIYLFLFSGAMLGLVFAENLILLFIFWELTTVLSFMLISFFHEKDTSRRAAFQSLFLTGFGGLSLLAGIILLGTSVDSYSVTTWIENAEAIKESRVYLPGLILVLLGVFTKSAQFPFHFWLPGAMQAPGPVSAYLHSATMVKAGFYLLMRLSPVLGGTPEWVYIISMAGVVTMLLGSYLAITQRDIKAILAFTTINALGMLILLVGIDTKLSLKAALLFLFVHAFYKAALFMISGIIEKKTGTREVEKLGGLAGKLPVTAVVTVFLALSMAGLPPMLGFLGKELIYEAKLQLPGVATLVLILGVASNIFMVIISLLFTYKIFFGKPGDKVSVSSRAPLLMLAGPIVLALLSLFFGFFPQLLGGTLIESALSTATAIETDVKLKIWHGFNDVFFLSLFTVLSGITLTLLMVRFPPILRNWRKWNDRIFFFQPSDVFERLINGFVSFSDRKTGILQHGYHRYYMLTLFVIAGVAIWFQIIYTWGWKSDVTFTLQPFYISGLVAFIVSATIYSIVSRSRVATIIALGVVGYGISLIYLYYSAIDLAITQILVETLIVVMFVLVLQRLPKFARLSSRWTKLRDLAIALVFGAVMTITAIKAIHVDFNHPISDFFLENSYPRGYGNNVVNVILVDFRALDTMGEIIVLTIAAVGVSLLFNLKGKKR